MAEKPTKICDCNIKKEAGYLYFIGKDGNAYKVKMARGRGRKKE